MLHSEKMKNQFISEQIKKISSGISVLEAIKDGKDFIFKDIDLAAERVGVIKKWQVIGKSILELFPEAKYIGLLEVLQRVWTSGESANFKDPRAPQERFGCIYKLCSGEVVMVYHDLNDDKGIKEKLNQLWHSFNAAGDAIVLVKISDEGIPVQFLEANEVYCKCVGYTREELLFLSPLRVYTNEMLLNIKKLTKATMAKGSCVRELVHATKSGKKILVEINARFFELEGEKVILAIVRDITCRGKSVISFKKERGIENFFQARYYFRDFKYRSLIMENIIDKAKLISKSDRPVILQGESGTGKELLASAIHNESLRRKGPFVSLNCASLTQSLLESELFGYVEGAFTGAVKGGKKGKIELAHNGTLFLDEIGDLSLAGQAMLLRVIQEKEFIRIGDEKITRVDVRIICATNQDLKKLCEEKRFRWDLYYRLTGMILVIPPLRERKEDIFYLANILLEKINTRNGLEKIFSEETLILLENYPWLGNVRQMENVIESAYILTPGKKIHKGILKEILENTDPEVILPDDNEMKKNRLIGVLDDVGGNISKAAKDLGISRSTAYRWLKELEEGK